MSPARCIVVGGGLAGLTCALELAERGVAVTVLEAEARAGGKVGSDPDAAGRLRDHGIHIFPGWYVNTRALLARIGASGALVDHDRVGYLEHGRFPRIRYLLEPDGLASGWKNTFRGPLPWWRSMLFQYFTLDLAGQRLDEHHYLDRISELGLLYERWYRDEGVASFLESNVMHAAAVYADEVSARSWQRILRYWLRTPKPFFSTVDGDLQTRVIAPFLARLAARGVTVHTDRRVVSVGVAGGRVSGVTWQSAAGATGTETGDVYVIATPLEAMQPLVGDAVYGAAPDLGSVQRLSAEPMSGFYAELSTKIPHLGANMVFLMGSRHSLSVMDLTPAAATTTLGVIVADFGPMRGLSDARAKHLLVEEIGRFLPVAAGNVVSAHLHKNTRAPLFINTCGSWYDRPGPRTAIPNLFLAGDYCQNAIDLACMEGAVSSALDTAKELLGDLGVRAAGAARPAETPTFVYRALTAAAAPVMVVPWLVARWKRARVPRP